MKIKTSELEGAALDWAVAKACGVGVTLDVEFDIPTGVVRLNGSANLWRPSTDWSQGGPLIGSNSVWLSDDEFDEYPETKWTASIQGAGMQEAQTPLIAACRAIVAAKLGDVVEVPDELA